LSLRRPSVGGAKAFGGWTSEETGPVAQDTGDFNVAMPQTGAFHPGLKSFPSRYVPFTPAALTSLGAQCPAPAAKPNRTTAQKPNHNTREDCSSKSHFGGLIYGALLRSTSGLTGRPRHGLEILHDGVDLGRLESVFEPGHLACGTVANEFADGVLVAVH
jgi:hypothetical protein